MSPFETLPQEVLIDDILPLLSLRDLLSTFQACKFLYRLGQDDIFWRRRLMQDFNFTSASNARDTGFQFLYSRLHRPLVYVWGGSGQGRLGRPISIRRGASMGDTQFFPLQLDIPGCRIVELGGGGWSFTALDSNGQLYVWGQLAGSYASHDSGFEDSHKQAPKPLRLVLPTPIKAFSCGRNFTTALDHEGTVWCFNNWGTPFTYTPAAFDSSNPDDAVVQVESGWAFSAALVASGAVYCWDLFGGDVGRAARRYKPRLAHSIQPTNFGSLANGAILCKAWSLEGIEPHKLPELPQLPKLTDDEATHPLLIKIAAGDGFLIGLTDGGHVVKIVLHQDVQHWEYMPLFSETNKVKGLPEFRVPGGPTPPSELKISHISAHFHSFAVYSTGKSSVVLMGRSDASSTTRPTIISALQNRGVISVVLGDYHFGALLESGQLLTWGNAIGTGLGDPYEIEPGKPGGFRSYAEKALSLRSRQSIPVVKEPTEVRFDEGPDEEKLHSGFVFSAAAAGWHMGALVVDLKEASP